MPERTETGYEVFPEAKDLLLTVEKPAEKGKTLKGKYYYVFKFKAVLDGRTRKYSEAMMTWMAGDLLAALKCARDPKDPKVFLWEKDEIVGRQVVADIVHEPDFKDPEKVVAKMKNVRPVDDLTGEAEPPAEPSEDEGVPAGAEEEGLGF